MKFAFISVEQKNLKSTQQRCQHKASLDLIKELSESANALDKLG